MRKRIFVLLLTVLICTGCGGIFTEDQVNSTVVAKIKEVAGLQRVNVTVETVIVKEYVVVTATPGPTEFIPVQFSTMTPVGFDRFTKEQVYQALAAGGLTIRQYYFELGEDEIDGLTKQTISATKFTVTSDLDEHFGKVYVFNKPSMLEDANNYLKSSAYSFNGNPILVKDNIIVELDSNTPAETVSAVRTILDGMH
ncbi:MAG: hypothetical protein AB9907_07870 [Flexilinea sp.]